MRKGDKIMKQNKKLLALLLVLAIAFTSLTLVACTQGGDKNGGQGDAGVTQEVKNPGDIVKNADGTVTFMDMNNVVHKNIKTGKQRIINLWPANTSTFFGIGAGDKLLATSIQQAPWVEVFYPAIKTRKDFVLERGINVTAEYLVNRNPDLVIVHPSNGKDLQKQLLAVGVDAIFINFSDFESMKKCYKIVGALLGGEYETKLNYWCTRVDKTKAKIKAKTDLLKDTERPVVLYCTGIGKKEGSTVTEFSTMGANSIFQDWCEIAGGKYFMAEHTNIQGMTITQENVLDNWPGIILCAGANQNKTYETLKAPDSVYAEHIAKNGTKIVKNPYVLFDIARFGFEALLQMSQAVSVIQPAIAAELGIDMKNEIKWFYSTFADVTLSDEQVQLIIDGKKPNGDPI